MNAIDLESFAEAFRNVEPSSLVDFSDVVKGMTYAGYPNLFLEINHHNADVVEWIERNVDSTNFHVIHWHRYGPTFLAIWGEFASDEDAMLFKLKFGGKK